MSQQLVDAAKAPIRAYNEKDWEAVERAVTSDFRFNREES